MNTIQTILSQATGRISFDNLSQLDSLLGIKGNIDDLKEDLLQIEYPGGLLIDLGWYPSFNPEGAFQLTGTRSERPFRKPLVEIHLHPYLMS